MKKGKEETMDITKPSLALLAKLGSLIVHYQEWTSPKGHPLDKQAIETLESDPEVIEWMAQMKKAQFIAEKR